MALELTTKTTTNGSMRDKDTVFLMGGLAMLVLGTGLVLASPIIRRYVSQLGLGNLFHKMMPDVERYLRLRSM